jgi:hypothetical protein
MLLLCELQKGAAFTVIFLCFLFSFSVPNVLLIMIK